MEQISVDEGIRRIKPGAVIVASMAAAEPQLFLRNVHRFAGELDGARIYCANPSVAYPCFDGNSFMAKVEIVPMFLTRGIRSLQGRGFVHYFPQHLSQWSSNILARGSVDVFWGSCSVPDERGFVSLGPSCCYETEIIRKARQVILECNPKIPATHGSSFIHVRDIHCLVPSDAELPTLEPCEAGDQAVEAIAGHVAALIDDGSTIQLGIGAIPNAVCRALRSKSDLGVHTEMIHDGMLDLYNSGNVTNRRKTVFPGRMVGSFAQGRRELYEFIDRNPGVELHPSSIVNRLDVMGRNHRMTSINTAVEIDITGQVCSESVGHAELSGVGGAFETHLGAQCSEGGRGIIAINSVTKDRRRSKINIELLPGAKVSIPRNDIDTVVTEFGAFRLKGKSVAERALGLISIAHPSFRDELLARAKDLKYI